jgi:hypothetical protein
MDKRGAHRLPTDVAAECRSCDHSWSTRLINISTTGCMIACPEQGLPDGARLRLRVRGLTAIDGEIMWQHRNHAGIRFSVPLHPAMTEYLASGAARGCNLVEAASAPEAPNRPARAASGLRGELDKRTWAEPGESEPRRASAG